MPRVRSLAWGAGWEPVEEPETALQARPAPASVAQNHSQLRLRLHLSVLGSCPRPPTAGPWTAQGGDESRGLPGLRHCPVAGAEELDAQGRGAICSRTDSWAATPQTRAWSWMDLWVSSPPPQITGRPPRVRCVWGASEALRPGPTAVLTEPCSDSARPGEGRTRPPRAEQERRHVPRRCAGVWGRGRHHMG